jgi:hypothetical protein
MALVTSSAWLARLRHDLLKPLLWPARDRREMGGAPAAGELDPSLIDEEGRAVSASALWASLRAEAPSDLDLTAFDAALTRALAAATRGDVAGVLALEPEVEALARLVRNLEGR